MPHLTRRDFLKLGGLSLASLAFAPHHWPPERELAVPVARARVTTQAIYFYREPDYDSERIGTYPRDQILNIFEVIRSPHGPRHNPRWYRLANGFAHSAYLQRVEKAHYNPVLHEIPESGRLGEITVPFSQSMRPTRAYGWVPLYRLYYQSVYWITSLEEGPDGKPWYGLTDDLLHVKYCIPASHMRPVEPAELAPISPEVPLEEKHIEISNSDQTLTAYEGDRAVLHTHVSTGIPSSGPTPNGIPTDTPNGHFRISVKLPSRHMGDGNLTDDVEAYELPGVPWVSFFHATGVAMHGTYWHDNFGRMMSHGCVNMRNQDALWVYRWSMPAAGPEDWNSKGSGTRIRVI